MLLVISIIIGIAPLYLAIHYLEKNYRQLLLDQQVNGLQQIEILSRDIVNTLASLNSLGIESCSPEAMLAMRKHLFLSDYIKDIGYLENDALQCTTGLGRLSLPYEEIEPDYIGPRQAKVWINKGVILFDNERQAIIVRMGDYNAVVSNGFLKDLINHYIQWELVYTSDKTTLHLAGTPSLYERYTEGRALPHIVEQSCSDVVPYCIVTFATKQNFYLYYETTLLSWVVLSFMTFCLAYVILNLLLQKHRSLESRLLRGLNKHCFYCLYQPIVNLSTGKIIGCEVLARFQDHKGAIFPDEFIPVIISKNKTWSFTRIIHDQAVRDIEKAAALVENFTLNINFFARDIDSGRILELTQAGKPQQFQPVVEVTEDERLSQQGAIATLNTLIEMGFQVAIDDFGTGYSNLHQLRAFPCHTLKIDRSFVSEMEGGAIRSTLIPHIVDMAENINVDIVAEGIENDMQRQALLELGVKLGQGYMFGKPMTMDKLCALIRSQLANHG